MKLVMLPGMDGTGRLFRPFLQHFNGDTTVIDLPFDGPQTHQELLDAVESRLPACDYVLLAESFAGGFVPLLLNRMPATHRLGIRGVVFSASFITAPSRLLRTLGRLLPIEWLLARKRAHNVVHRFLGPKTPQALVDEFLDVVKSVPAAVLRQRMAALGVLQAPARRFDLPALYLQAARDHVVSESLYRNVKRAFPRLEKVVIDCHHGVLQTQPVRAAAVVQEFMARVGAEVASESRLCP